ncbi:MAG: rod shape-determining protein MreC [Nitrospirae bacterium]|nr:MAG: rod shape-determining protein MreC [Nitrospirota bacterium]
MPRKRLLLFFSLVIVSFILMTYQSDRGISNPLKLLKYPVNAANNAIHSMCSTLKGSFKKMRLRDEENKRLREENNNLLMDRQKYKDAWLENARLMELLSLKEKEKRFVAAARVIARGNDRWANTLVIDKGSRNGIEKDMTVITPRGLVGKILSSSDFYSTVLLINDINFSAAIRLHESRTEGIISGTGSRVCILKYVSHEYEVRANETALTSGLDSLFPVDIPVGAVTKITPKGAGLFQNIEVVPFQDTRTLEEVVIVRR